jgi:hypothetical protein
MVIILLNDWFKSKFYLRKIYDSDKDEKTAMEFHKKCDEINNVLVLIESNFEKLFGGFTTTCFSSAIFNERNGNFEKDFIFSLSEKTVFRKITSGYGYQRYSIYNNFNSFPMIGHCIDKYFNYTYDIYLDCQCFQEKNNSYCSLGNGFSSPQIN